MPKKKDRKAENHRLPEHYLADAYETEEDAIQIMQMTLDRMDPEEARKVWERLPEEQQKQIHL